MDLFLAKVSWYDCAMHQDFKLVRANDKKDAHEKVRKYYHELDKVNLIGSNLTYYIVIEDIIE